MPPQIRYGFFQKPMLFPNHAASLHSGKVFQKCAMHRQSQTNVGYSTCVVRSHTDGESRGPSWSVYAFGLGILAEAPRAPFRPLRVHQVDEAHEHGGHLGAGRPVGRVQLA